MATGNTTIDIFAVLNGTLTPTNEQIAEAAKIEAEDIARAAVIKEEEEDNKKHICPRCNGEGKLPGYYHIQRGICFKCGGTGAIR